MRIGYFTTKFPYSQQFEGYPYGGSTLAAYYLAIEMAKRGHNVDVFTTSKNSNNSVEKHENMTIHRYGTNFRVLSSNISFGMFGRPKGYDADIVHEHFDIPHGPFAGLRYAKKEKIPLVVTYHGDWEESYGGLIRRVSVAFHNKFLVDKILSFADVIISPSKSYVDRSRFLGKYRDKIVVVPNGLPLTDFEIPYSKEECRERLGLSQHEKLILFFGFLSPYKGPDILIKAMPKVIKYISNVKLVFAGKGRMREELESLSRDLTIERNVMFMGFVPDGLKSLYYKAADVYCLPSMMKTECLPLTILEAMACGIPVIASDIGGIPDVVKSWENGLLVPPMNSNALADAIIYLLENEEVRKKMGEDGRKKVESYSWEKIAEETERVYMFLMGDLK